MQTIQKVFCGCFFLILLFFKFLKNKNQSVQRVVSKVDPARLILDEAGRLKSWGWRGRRSYAGNVQEVEVRLLLMALPDLQDL